VISSQEITGDVCDCGQNVRTRGVLRRIPLRKFDLGRLSVVNASASNSITAVRPPRRGSRTRAHADAECGRHRIRDAPALPWPMITYRGADQNWAPPPVLLPAPPTFATPSSPRSVARSVSGPRRD
jgi:hypothetical protein